MCMSPKLLQSCLTLCDPKDCSSPGSSVHEILQARILEWIAILSPRDLPDPGTESASPAAQQADSLLLSHWGSLNLFIHNVISIFPEGVESS